MSTSVVLCGNAHLHASTQRNNIELNGERIDKALHAIEEANIGKLRDVFQDISFNSNKLGEETGRIVQAISPTECSNYIIGAGYASSKT